MGTVPVLEKTDESIRGPSKNWGTAQHWFEPVVEIRQFLYNFFRNLVNKGHFFSQISFEHVGSFFSGRKNANFTKNKNTDMKLKGVFFFQCIFV